MDKDRKEDTVSTEGTESAGTPSEPTEATEPVSSGDGEPEASL